MWDGQRRALSLALALAALLLTGGCAQYYSPGTPTFVAEPAAPTARAVESAGYERVRATNRTVQSSDDKVTVRVTSRVSEYRRTVEVAGDRRALARLDVLATPEVRVFCDTYSPVEGLSDRDS